MMSPSVGDERILKILLLSLLCYHINCSRAPAKALEWCSALSTAQPAKPLGWARGQRHTPTSRGTWEALRGAPCEWQTGRTVGREMLNRHDPAFCAGEWCFLLPWNSSFNTADIIRAAKELLGFFWVAVCIPRSQPREMCLLSIYTYFFNNAFAGCDSTKQFWNHHCRRNTRQSTLCGHLVLGERQLSPCPGTSLGPMLLKAKSLFSEFWHLWYSLPKRKMA